MRGPIIRDGLELLQRHLPTSYSGCEQKLPWMTRELTSLKNNKTNVSKKSKDSEQRCLNDDAIDSCVCERLREKFFSLREYQQQWHARAYGDYRARIEKAIKIDSKIFF
jgi:hypothetical protein